MDYLKVTYLKSIPIINYWLCDIKVSSDSKEYIWTCISTNKVREFWKYFDVKKKKRIPTKMIMFKTDNNLCALKC